MSLHLVRMFPLSYYWQIIATGIMGVVVMALIPQQTARTVITSQMLMNLSESLGYKTPSKSIHRIVRREFSWPGPTGIFISDRLDHELDRLGLVADGCARAIYLGLLVSRRAAADAGGHRHHLSCAVSFFIGRNRSRRFPTRWCRRNSKFLGPLSSKEWISLAVLLFHGGWLAHRAISRHRRRMDRHHRVCGFGQHRHLDWSMMRKGIDWELLIHMGVTLSIPTLLKAAKIDRWLVDVISPLIVPFMDSPAWFFIVIALLNLCS